MFEASLRKIDLHVSQRIRQQRIILGLSQQQLARMINVTYQQAQKYETGGSRISAGRLGQIATALRVEVGHFFEGLDRREEDPFKSKKRDIERQLLLDLSRNFVNIRRQDHREAICEFARTLADLEEVVEGRAVEAVELPRHVP